ncbi:MAG TPA: Ohr family peroxiredoxin [Caulobacteraceae bacterium]|jgi:Ohr subfamily peroxiredoxin
MNILYTAKATTTGGGRNGGHGETSDGKVVVDFSMPKDLGGPGGNGTNPEQLVALGYSACFGSALQFVATRRKMTLEDVSVTAKVGMGRSPEGGFAFEIEIEALLPGLPQAEAEALTAEAHEVCPYSNAFRNGAPVTVTTRGAVAA